MLNHLFCVMLLSFATTQIDQPPAREIVALGQAQQDLEAGRFDKAERELKDAVQISPRSSALWNELGLVEVKMGKSDMAIAAFRKAVSSAPKDGVSLMNLAQILSRTGHVTEALDAYRTRLALNPNDPAMNEEYGLLLMRARRFKAAINHLEKARRRKGSNSSLELALTEAYFKASMKSQAEQEVEKLLQDNDLSTADQVGFGRILIVNHEWTAAQNVLEKAVASSPSSAEAHAALGLLLSEQGRLEQAAWELGQAAQLAPDDPAYSLGLARVLLLWKHYGTARDFLVAVKQRFGELPEYQYYFAYSLYGLRRFDEVISLTNALVVSHPRFAEAHGLLGNCYLSLGDLRKAEGSFRKAIDLNPKNASYYSSLAEVERLSKHVDEAISHSRRAMILDSTNSEAKLQLALCYEEEKNLTKAQTLLEEITQLHPELIAPHRVLARVYYEERKTEEAQQQRAIVADLEAKSQKLKPETNSAR